MSVSQIILILVGLFTIAGGIFDWDWFMGHRKARLFVKIFSRNGGRGFYIIFGFCIVSLGAFWER